MDIARNIFTLVAMVIVSFSVGFISWANIGLATTEAVVAGMAAFLIQFAGYLMIWKSFAYEKLKEDIHDLTLHEAENATNIERLSNEMKGLRKTLKATTQAEIEPIAHELEVVISLIKQLAENSSDAEMRIDNIQNELDAKERQSGETPPVKKQSKTKSTNASPKTGETTQDDKDYVDILLDEPVKTKKSESKKSQKPSLNKEGIDQDSPIMKAIHAAVDANNVDLYLQPIVTLPQRKPKFYEALSRIRNDEGDLIRPAQYLPSAERSGAMPILDKMLLVRAIQVLQRLLTRKSDSVVVCNIAARSIADTQFFNDFRSLLKSKKNLADHLIFEFNQETVTSFSAIEEESVRALKDLGFRFAIDNVTDISMDYQHLTDLGFQFIKISAENLLATQTTDIKDIHPHDIPLYLARNGLELIVDHIETENQIVELLDFDVKLGQGYLFAAPREVKPDVTMVRTSNENRLAS